MRRRSLLAAVPALAMPSIARAGFRHRQPMQRTSHVVDPIPDSFALIAAVAEPGQVPVLEAAVPVGEVLASGVEAAGQRDLTQPDTSREIHRIQVPERLTPVR